MARVRAGTTSQASASGSVSWARTRFEAMATISRARCSHTPQARANSRPVTPRRKVPASMVSITSATRISVSAVRLGSSAPAGAPE